MTGQDVIDAAAALLETPFVHQGRIPGVALDCAGVIVAVAAALGVEHDDVAGYPRLPSNGVLRCALDRQPGLIAVRNDAIAPGDILLMRFKREPQHLGIYTGKTIIHAWQIIGKVCEHDFDEDWHRRLVVAYRFNGVANG